jgi:hypothetical protein
VIGWGIIGQRPGEQLHLPSDGSAAVTQAGRYLFEKRLLPIHAGSCQPAIVGEPRRWHGGQQAVCTAAA